MPTFVANFKHALLTSPNVENWTRSVSLNILDAWDQSASLEESCMLMEVFISMCSAVGRTSSDRGVWISSMLTAATRTLCHLEAALKLDTTTRSRMDALWQEGSSGQASMELLRMARSGGRSSVLRVQQSFGDCLRNWIHAVFVSTTEASRPSASTGTKRNHLGTPIHPISDFDLTWYLSFLNGETPLLVDLE